VRILRNKEKQDKKEKSRLGEKEKVKGENETSSPRLVDRLVRKEKIPTFVLHSLGFSHLF